MEAYVKKPKQGQNVWSILIQMGIAILTALSGIFVGCQMASS